MPKPWLAPKRLILLFSADNPLASNVQLHQEAQNLFAERCQFGFIKLIAQLTDRFGLSRVGVNRRADFRQPEPVGHRNVDFRDHVASVLGNDRRSDDRVSALSWCGP